MNLYRSAYAVALLLTGAMAVAGKPGSTTFEPELAYTILTGSTELRVTDATGTKSATLYSIRENIDIDLSPRAQRQIAIGELNSLKLLTYSVDSSGVKTTSVTPLYTGAARIDDVDFSPDGTKIAFTEGFTRLMVLDLAQPVSPTNPTQWASDPGGFIGQVTWYKGGAAIAYIGPLGSGTDQVVYEVTAPGATPTPLLQEPQFDSIDASHADPDSLVVSYNRPGPQGPRVGLWKAGGYVNASLAGNVFSDYGSVNCDDSKVAYGTPDSKGQLIWYIRQLPNGPSTLYTKTLRVRQTQFMPTCAAAAAQTNSAFDFRVPPGN